MYLYHTRDKGVKVVSNLFKIKEGEVLFIFGED